ncbi:MAG: hypothetical protein ABJN40_06705 [Sneathiella sp.]
MDPVRSVSYPAQTLNPSAFRQAETGAYVELKTDDQQRARLNRLIDTSDQQGVAGRRRQAILVESDARRPAVTSIFVQPQAQPKRDLPGLVQPPMGQSSSAFLAQQLSQEDGATMQGTTDPVHQEAAGAYHNTLGLTATVLGLQGTRERLI